jgi:hypothetical protein
MGLLRHKKKLLKRIETSNDEVLIAELLGVIERHDVVIELSNEQKSKLKERIQMVEEGKAVYYNARETAQKIKDKLK